ncbi:hypothetical protein [Phenylobacterium sp.]|uniref:hypothetical protein n=1 Tax=Phenylobacterium sp. TaxID=1871053 RepID=UPI002F92D529
MADLADVTVLSKPVDRPLLRSWLAAVESAPQPRVLTAGVQELAAALAPDAADSFTGVPAQLERLRLELVAALATGDSVDLAAACHRSAGLAAHSGLFVIAAHTARSSRKWPTGARSRAMRLRRPRPSPGRPSCTCLHRLDSAFRAPTP